MGFEKVGDIVIDEVRDIKILFMKKDDIYIELVEPISKESSFYPLLKKYKNTAYHICYQVDSIEETIRELRKKGFVQTTKIQPAKAISGHNVVFMLHPNMGLIELLEMKDEGTGVSI